MTDPKPLRVLHVHSGNLYGGVESMLLTTTVLKDAAPIDNRFALCFEDRLSQELKEAGASVSTLGAVRVSRPWTGWSARRRLSRLLAADRPDVAVVHSGWSHAIFGPTIQRSRIPLVRWFHAIPDDRNRLDRWSRHTLPTFSVANSDYTAAGVRKQDGAVPLAVVRPPVPPPPAEASSSRARIRAELGAKDGTCVILQVGRMEAGKGHRVLFQALAQLKDRSDWVAWEAGGAQREEELGYVGALGLLAAKHGIASRIRFLGERRDVRNLLAAADVYCQPNQTPESFGITFVEALYAGLPVVTSAMGGAKEIVDTSCGVLVPAGDAVALADALWGMIGDRARRRAAGAAGPMRALTLCDPAARVREMHQALATAASSRYG